MPLDGTNVQNASHGYMKEHRLTISVVCLSTNFSSLGLGYNM
jgi:hypothetical protein